MVLILKGHAAEKSTGSAIKSLSRFNFIETLISALTLWDVRAYTYPKLYT